MKMMGLLSWQKIKDLFDGMSEAAIETNNPIIKALNN